MSEFSVYSYYVKSEAIKKAIGSKDAALTQKLTENKNYPWDQYQARIEDQDLDEVIKDLINGNISKDSLTADSYEWALTYSLWKLVEEIAHGKPNQPDTDMFEDLYDFTELLEENDVFPQLKNLFEALNCGDNSSYGLPIRFDKLAPIPCIAYIETVNDSLLNEAKQMLEDITDFADWTCEWEYDFEGIEDVLNLVIETHEHRESLCLILEGDL